jgi:hypothetical protein
MKEQQPQLNVDLANTTPLETSSGKHIFQQGFILRSISKFIIGSNEDAIIPIPVFYDPESGKMLLGTLPPELREEYKDHIILQ